MKIQENVANCKAISDGCTTSRIGLVGLVKFNEKMSCSEIEMTKERMSNNMRKQREDF